MVANLLDQVNELLNGDRTVLSKAITLAESKRIDHQLLAQDLLKKVYPHTGNAKRIAITGVPGVGKSTFIEAFGQYLIELGHKVAVLAIDPSSTFSKGSILGDKTRMEDLARHPNAYIRPSATGGNLGGIASRTYEAMLLCEAAGFDMILVETVGVGQSETLVNEITDFFLYLHLPGSGDELQGIKRGIMEMADLVFVNKADEFGENKAKEARVELARSMQFLPPKPSGWKRHSILGSGLKQMGLQQVYQEILNYYQFCEENNYLSINRNRQKVQRAKAYIAELEWRAIQNKLKKRTLESLNDESGNPYELALKWWEKEAEN